MTTGRDQDIEHLFRRAAFGASREAVSEFARLGFLGFPTAAASLVDYTRVPDDVDDFIGRPGYAGITAPGGFQPNSNIAHARQRWLFRMIHTRRPLQEKMALFWHNHFATAFSKIAGELGPVEGARVLAAKPSEDPGGAKGQLELLREHALGNFRNLLLAIAQDPAMLVWLDGRTNFRSRPQENFARELMELFTMGVGTYSEHDVREGARAFTGWYFDNLTFKVDAAKHDGGPKTFLGKTGNFDGVDALRIIFQQPITAEYLAGKIYRFLVRDELSPELQKKLGAVLRDADYEVKPLLTTIFSSRDFYSDASYGAHIKSPVEHFVAMLKHLGADAVPGVPDFNQATGAMGQNLLNPPSVAGWAGGRAWITPNLLIARGNVARDVLMPDMTGFRDPNFAAGSDGELGRRLREGYDIGAATAVNDPANMSAFDRAALERDEQFNTRISGYIGWEQAARKLIPTPRHAAGIDLSGMVRDGGARTTSEAVDYLLWRMLRVPASKVTRDGLVSFLTSELGTDSLERAKTYMEDPLRLTVHLIMSTPEYQLT
jgi:uncharacterized protein (DUF1800 family)